MKKTYTLLLFLLATVSILAQVPEKMSYQAVLRDASNTLLTNQEVGMQISILQSTITGVAVYIETQTTTTNINGLVSIAIGSGISSDDFSAIDWSAGPYFIKTATDPSGGSSYSITGTSQLMSVPFAMYATTSGSAAPGPQGAPGIQGESGIQGAAGAQGIQGATGTAGTNGINGEKGATGDQGTQGIRGNTGSVGAVGATGTNGTNGAKGDTGITGDRGDVGEKGDTGDQGTQGIRGNIGSVGAVGATGTNGTNGAKGDTGITGDKGDVGEKGDTGDQGTQGIQGNTGSVGAVGATGTNGAKGDTGITGDRGDVGEKGDTGDQGTQGIQGNIGSVGAVGATGTNGTNGAKGDTGITGDKGDVGEKGATGDQGIQGVQGNIGLIGAVGATGTNGTNGAKGDTGITGDKGDVGEKGIQGIQGATGADGVSGSIGITGADGVSGSIGATGADGASGAIGATGAAGTTGATGLQGASGAAGLTTAVNAIAQIDGNITLTTTNIPEGDNKYYTEAAVSANTAVAANTAKVGITTAQAATISNTTGINTGDQDLTGLETRITALEPATAAAAIGDFIYGGVVFYLDESGKHGLVCAVNDQSSVSNWGDAISFSSSYDGGGFIDWYLPSITELSQMYTNRVLINSTASSNGGTDFSLISYWSSTDASNTDAYNKRMVNFSNGDERVNSQYNGGPNGRAVRAFTQTVTAGETNAVAIEAEAATARAAEEANATNISTLEGEQTLQNTDVAANTAKVGYTEVLVSANTAVAANTAKVGYTEAAVSANTDVAANTLKVGYTDALVLANTAVVANTLKVGITTQQATDITSNNAKTGISSDQADAIEANTTKVGITTVQSEAIIANTSGIATNMTNAQRQAISNPSAGLQVFVTDFDGGTFMFYDGTKWGTLSFTKTIPDAPIIGTATLGNAQATVPFTAPSSDGGSAITSYTATSSPGGITGTLSQSGSGSITVTGLTNTTAYTFTVTATNAIGTSLASAASNSVVPAIPTIPDAPTIGTATAVNSGATVPFTAPSSDGRSAITSYTATSSPDGITGTISQSGSGSITVSGLTNDTAYTFTVTATNAIGTSAASDASNSVIPRLQVGDFYQGGVVFHLFVDGETGYVSGEIHGLIAAVQDQSSGIRWYNGSNDTTGATGTAEGTGATNTTTIIAVQGATEISYAAGLARAYSGGGYDDWFLPSKNELNQMFTNKATINTTASANGGSNFAINYYWSSTEYDSNKAWQQNFNNGSQYGNIKSHTSFSMRAVRAF